MSAPIKEVVSQETPLAETLSCHFRNQGIQFGLGFYLFGSSLLYRFRTVLLYYIRIRIRIVLSCLCIYIHYHQYKHYAHIESLFPIKLLLFVLIWLLGFCFCCFCFPLSRINWFSDSVGTFNKQLMGTINFSLFLVFWLAIGCVHGKRCDGDSSGQNQAGSKHILNQRSLEVVPVPLHNIQLQYSVLTQSSYYTGSLEKENQDSFCIKTQLQGNPNIHFFGVFDGHGLNGAECSNFVKDMLVEIIANDSTLLNDPVRAYNAAFGKTNSELHSSEIDDSMSGTTAITVLVIGDTIYVANVGDSRAVIAVKSGNRIIAESLSNDQTPFRRDEYKRVKSCGARVLSVDQVKGYKDPKIQTWGNEESQGVDPPRLWVKKGMYPGTAFTRSVGDRIAESVGVIAEPEVSVVRLMPNHLFFVVASDGVYEFLSSQTVVDMVARYKDPRDACAAIARESYKLWLDHENRTDDITIIIVHIKIPASESNITFFAS